MHDPGKLNPGADLPLIAGGAAVRLAPAAAPHSAAATSTRVGARRADDGADEARVKIAAALVFLAGLASEASTRSVISGLTRGSTLASIRSGMDPRLKAWDDGEWGLFLPNSPSAQRMMRHTPGADLPEDNTLSRVWLK
jgi:hypothetical protein